ncbi:hypothetical protein NC653_004216 [Populus alba x Populus x berolinensis]|uniref:Uncharacterized protein n=2 Tax=Populus TaxID=3689 RepID=A0A4U5QTY5_POPAL|nr:hypothetical protein NC653_004216 [Populus alba x Populus x berolinensis]TKS13909.1 hypothetical protein D5086_0000048670 [Populus alba]
MLFFILKISPPDGTDLVSPPPTHTLEVLDSSHLSSSPTLSDSSGTGIVFSSSLVDYGLHGSSANSLNEEEAISNVALENSSVTTDAINWVFNLITGVQGPGVLSSSCFVFSSGYAPFYLLCWFWLVGLGFLAGSGWFACAYQASSTVGTLWDLTRSVLAALFLGSCGDYSHYALFIDAMDFISLGAALSLIVWATDVVLSASMLVRLKDIGGSLIIQLTSKWRVLD